jgi:CubicO group peptidase (beta-lactamase class C family)
VGQTVNNNSYSLEGYSIPLKFHPGDGWIYGVGLDWAGRVVEVLTKMTLGEYMQKHIWTPLGMSSTTFRLAQRPDLAVQHAAMGLRAEPRGTLTLGADPVPEVPTMESGGSGLFSTANDYSKFLGALLTGKILTKDTVESMCKPQLPDNTHLMGNFHNEYMHDLFCVEYPIGLQANYGLGGAINIEDAPDKRRKGSMMWSGMANTRWVSLEFWSERSTDCDSGWTCRLGSRLY